MTKSCKTCGQNFPVPPEETAFYAKMNVPVPLQCPPCRRQHRLLFRNFFKLYHRTCDLTGKKIIAMYDKDMPFPVYEMHEWWGDKWDALSYGQNIDFSRPFFDQLRALHNAVPRMSIVNSQSENTDYCNFSFQSRNCYLIFGNVGNEDCAYGHIVWQSKDTFDCLYCYKCQFCYECTDCVQCHSTFFSRDCDNCSSSAFLVHCVGCQDCFGCVGLKNKQYHIFNEPYEKEEYQRRMKELNLGSRDTVEMAKRRVQELIGREVVKYYHGFNCENVVGDYLYNCRTIFDGYDLKNCEDCRHCTTLDSFRDCQDCNFAAAPSELVYNCLTVYGYNLISCQACLTESSNLAYCDNCYSCQDCFGCAGLKKKQYCILNKQYTKEEYAKLLPKVIEHMKQSGDWGEFFPQDMTPFAYNETIAQQYFPLSKEEITAKGLRWKDEEEQEKQESYLGPVVDIPDDVRDADESICSKILRCEVTGKLYKIIPQELKFHKDMGLPLPRTCPDQRHKDRMAQRNPRYLWKRECGKCGKSIETTYAPERPENVYCEECYLSTVY